MSLDVPECSMFLVLSTTENFSVNLLMWRIVKTVALYRVAESLTDSPGNRIYRRTVNNFFLTLILLKTGLRHINLTLKISAYNKFQSRFLSSNKSVNHKN